MELRATLFLWRVKCIIKFIIILRPVRKIEIMAVGLHCDDHATLPLLAKVGTNFADGRWSLSIVIGIQVLILQIVTC
jgi:hypothetical protein